MLGYSDHVSINSYLPSNTYLIVLINTLSEFRFIGPSIMALATSFPSLVKVQVVTVAFLPVGHSHDHHVISHMISYVTCGIGHVTIRLEITHMTSQSRDHHSN